jgi:transcriptional regulator with XRE-family HTH domain
LDTIIIIIIIIIMEPIKVANRIRAARLAAGLSQQQLAAILGTHQSAVSGWERGLMPRATRLAQIAEILGTTVEHLLGGSPAQKKKRR